MGRRGVIFTRTCSRASLRKPMVPTVEACAELFRCLFARADGEREAPPACTAPH